MTGRQCVACGGRGGQRGFPLRVDARRAVSASGGLVPAEAARLLVWVRGAAPAAWLLRRLRVMAGLRGPLQLLADEHVLLPDTPLAVLRPNSTVTVVPTSYEWFIEKFNEKVINSCHSNLKNGDPIDIDHNSIDTIDTNELQNGMEITLHNNAMIPSSLGTELEPENNTTLATQNLNYASVTINSSTVAINGPGATLNDNTLIEANLTNGSLVNTVDTSDNNNQLIEAETELEILKKRALEMLPDEPPSRRRRRRVRRRKLPKCIEANDLNCTKITSSNSSKEILPISVEPVSQFGHKPSQTPGHLFFNLFDTEEPVSVNPEIEMQLNTTAATNSEDLSTHSEGETAVTDLPCHTSTTTMPTHESPLVHHSSQVVRFGPKQTLPRLVRSLN